MIYGYVRVSSKDQNEARQNLALWANGIPPEYIFTDKQSGKDFNRPAWKKLVKILKRGDVLCVKSIDRLGRDYDDIQQQWRHITREIGADIVVMDMPLLDTRKGKDLLGTFVADMVLQVLSFVAENERTNIKQRQAEGIAAAKQRGVRFGRPTKPLPENWGIVLEQYRSGAFTCSEAARACGMNRSRFYYHAKQEAKS